MDLKNIQVRVNKPYPEIEKALNDRYTVGILKNLATAKISELSAVLQYIFQSVIADKTDYNFGKIFEEIGIVEMIHLSMLMHAITDFGGVPKYEDAAGNIFNTSQINYTMKLKEMLEANIKDETMAIEDYTLASEQVTNESLKRLLLRIREDEKHHLEILKYLLNNVTFLSI